MIRALNDEIRSTFRRITNINKVTSDAPARDQQFVACGLLLMATNQFPNNVPQHQRTTRVRNTKKNNNKSFSKHLCYHNLLKENSLT